MTRFLCIALAFFAPYSTIFASNAAVPTPEERAFYIEKAENYGRFMNSRTFKDMPRSLYIVNLHNGERLNTLYYDGAAYDKNAMSDISYTLRDRRNDEMVAFDQQTLDMIFALTEIFDYNKPVEVISAYRSPETNAHLRKKSRGVAKNSRHMHGEAIDIRFKEVNMTLVRDAAKALRKGGVGYYYKSNFVHVDSGPVRSWGSPAPYEHDGDDATSTASK